MKRSGERVAALGAIVNEVIVGGRISGAPEQRELPSGDTVLQLRLVVLRSSPRVGVGEVARQWTRSTSHVGLKRCSAKRFALNRTIW